ncbi:oligoendopeptidase F, partial [Enterococcus faecalis]
TLGNGAEAFLAALEFVLEVYRKVETLYVNSHLKNDQDTTNTAYQALYARASSLYAQVSEAVSWFDPEVLTFSDEQIWGYFEEQPKFAVYGLYIE